MSNEIESIGVSMDTRDIDRGIKSLEVLASKGAPVEKAMAGVEASAAKTGKTLANLGQGSTAGLKSVGDESAKTGRQMADLGGKSKTAADQLGQVGKQGSAAATGVGQAGKAAGTSASEFTRMASAATGAGSSLAAAAGAAAGLFAGLSIAGTVGKVVAVQREFDVLNSSLKTVSGSSAAAEREMAWLKQFAKDTPYGLAQATQGFVKMKALGLDPTRASLTSFGNTASAMGKDLNQMVEAVADASTGEFERLKEFGIKAKVEGDKVSLTFQGVTKTIENSAKDITKYLEDIGNNQFGGAMAERAKTLDGVIAGLGDTWDELFRTISSNGAGTLIYDTVTSAASAIEDATTILRAFNGVTDEGAEKSKAFGAVQEGLARTFETVAVMAAQLSYVLQGVGREIGGWAAQLNALEIGPAELANPAAAAAAALGALAKGRGEVVAQISRDMKADAEAARRDIDALTERILNARKVQEEYNRYKTRNDGAATDPRRLDLGKDTSAQDAEAARKAEADLLAIRQKLYGQDKDYLPTLAKLQAARDARTITEKEYIALVSELAKANYKQDKGSKDAAAAAKTEQSAYASLIATIREKIAANDLEAAGGLSLTESQRLRIKLDQDLLSGKLKLGSANERQARAEINVLAVSERNLAISKEATKVAIATAAARAKETEGIEAWMRAQEDAALQSAKSIADRISGLADEEEAVELARKTNISLAEAIERVAIARLREKRDGPTGAYEGSPEYIRLTEEIKLRERLADGLGKKDGRERSDEAAKRAAEDWQRAADDINRSLTDAFVNSFETGESLGKNLAKSLKSIFANMVLRPVISAVMSPISGVINGVVNSAIGGITGGGGGGDLGTALQLGSLAYQGYTGTGMVGTAWGALSSAMGFGSAAVGSSAATLAATPWAGASMAGMGATSAATSAMGAMGAAGIAGAIALAVINVLGGMRSETMIGSGLRGTLGNGSTLTPWQEWREGGTIASGPEFSTANPLENLQSYRDRLKALQDSGGGASQTAMIYETIIGEMEKNTKGLEEATRKQSDSINKAYDGVRSNVVKMANSLGLAGDKVKDFAFVLETQDLNFQGLTAEQIQEKITTVLGKAGTNMAKELLGYFEPVTETITKTVQDNVGSALAGQDAQYVYRQESETETKLVYRASQYAKAGETALETLTRLSTAFTTLNEAADALGFGAQQGSLAVADFADSFIELAGGLERFTATTNAFIQNYLSPDKQREYLARSGARDFQALGLNVSAESLLGATPDQIFAAVNSLYSDPKLYLDAMDVANKIYPIYSSLDTAAEKTVELKNEIDQLTEAYKSAIKSLGSESDNLAVELLKAQGKDKEAAALLRQQFLDSFVDENGNKLDQARLNEIAAKYDANRATEAYIKGIKDAAQAQLDALDKLRTSSIEQIDTAAGKTDAALAAYERAADKERERLQGVIDDVRGVFEAAKEGARSLFDEVEAVVKFQGAEGRDFISNALAQVQAGGALPDGKDLSEAISAVGKDFASTQYASQAEADFQRLVVANELKGLQDASGDQLTTAEKQLDTLNEQVEWARDQVNLLRGIDSSLKDLPTAIANLIAAYNAESQTRSNVGAKAIIGTGSAIYDKATGTGKTSSGAFFDASDMAEVARDVIAANGAAGKASVLDALEGKGFTMAQYDQMFGLPAGTLEAEARALGKPIYHTGTTYVPQTGFALLQQGEAVIPAAYNPWANGAMGGSDQAVIAELRAVKAELLEIRRQNDNLNYQAKRTADATNGQPEAPGLVSIV